jgi:FlaA1/EpsC-like NDP-sugar epimerase
MAIRVLLKLLTDKWVRWIIPQINRNRTELVLGKGFNDHCQDQRMNIDATPERERIGGEVFREKIKTMNIEDLLGREPLWMNKEAVAAGLKDTVVLVTGAAGSVGSGIVSLLMDFECKQVILLDQAEQPLSELQKELLTSFPHAGLKAVIGSVTDSCWMRRIFEKYKPQYVFHAAAYKQVPLMEAAPYEAILTNVGGTRLLADLSVEFSVKKFMMISTNDAVNPTNVVGASQRIGEICVQALAQLPQMKTQFIVSRFGNVLGSNGSVVPLFRKQIETGGPVTVTHPDIARRFISVAEAAQLILESAFMGQGSEIYLFDMGEPVKIYDLAVKMISLAGLKPEVDIPIVFTGLRPGEKLFEELLADTENTISTHHPKIKVAKVREHDFDLVKLAVDELLKATQTDPETDLVQRMKKLVPEFISNNSKYCRFDEVTV